MGPQDGVDYLLRSIHYIIHKEARNDFHVLIIGGGTELADLRSYARELEVESALTFAGMVSPDDPMSFSNN